MGLTSDTRQSVGPRKLLPKSPNESVKALKPLCSLGMLRIVCQAISGERQFEEPSLFWAQLRRVEHLSKQRYYARPIEFERNLLCLDGLLLA